MPRRRAVGSAASLEAPLTAISSSLSRLRGDINALVETATSRPTASRRAALVDVHHQLRVLSQRVNAALGAPASPAQDSQQP